LSVIIFVFYSKNQLLYLVFRLGAATSLLVLLGFYLIPDATRYLSAIFVSKRSELTKMSNPALILPSSTSLFLFYILVLENSRDLRVPNRHPP